MLQVRPAALIDIPGIMTVEQETFGEIGEDAMAAEEIMQKRISLCNGASHRWFWVAVADGEVVGDIVLQPTRLSPEACTSWSAATDDGTLAATFDSNGENVYVVSLAVSLRAPYGASYVLAHAAFLEWLRAGKKLFMFCSRMPGFASAHRASGVSPEAYWRLKRHDGGPQDPMLHLYWEMTGGAEPSRLLKDGFPPDTESGGHGVFFAARDPVKALHALAGLIYASGVKEGRRLSGAAHGDE